MLDQMNYQIYPYHINKITNAKTNYSPPLLNFKNIQIKQRLTISLYSILHYSPSLYSPLSQNFQTQHKSDHTPLSFEPTLRYCCLLPGFLIGVMQLMSAEITHGCWFPHHQNMNGIGCKWVYCLMALLISTKLSNQDRDFINDMALTILRCSVL